MRQLGIIGRFNFTPDGDLLVPTREGGMGIFDIFRTDDNFIEFLYGSGIIHEIQRYSFADQLKAACSGIFGIDPMLYQTDAGKNTLTHIRWSDFSQLLDAPTRKKLKEAGILDENMTVRHILQYFGTDICRKIDDNCWVRSTWDAVSKSMSKLCIIDDCRFKNEFYYFKERGAKTIRLKRKIEDSTVKSEIDMDDIPDDEYDLVIDNQDMEMHEKNGVVHEFLIKQNWLTATL